MINGDLIIHGKRADELIISDFTHAGDMSDWELYDKNNDGKSVYDVYEEKFGKDESKVLVGDIFGEEFGKAFYKHKHKLVAKSQIEDALKEREELNQYIKELQETMGEE